MSFFKKINFLSLHFSLVCIAILGLLVSSCCHNKTKSGPQLVLLKDRLINDVAIKDHSGWAFRKLEVSDELIALTYMQMGLLPDAVIPNAYDPKDFSSDFNKLKFLQKVTRLLKEQYFKPVIKEGVLSVRLASD